MWASHEPFWLSALVVSYFSITGWLRVNFIMAESVRVIGLAFLVIVGLGSCIGPSEITIDDDGEELSLIHI